MSAALPGYVYFDNNFVYHDGSKGKKLFVVLCDSTLNDDNVLVARTTSNSKSELLLGCFQDGYPPCFCLPVDISNFDDDTWIVLDEVFEMEVSKLERMNRTTDLTLEHTVALLDCGSESVFLAGWQKTALSEEADNLR